MKFQLQRIVVVLLIILSFIAMASSIYFFIQFTEYRRQEVNGDKRNIEVTSWLLERAVNSIAVKTQEWSKRIELDDLPSTNGLSVFGFDNAEETHHQLNLSQIAIFDRQGNFLVNSHFDFIRAKLTLIPSISSESLVVSGILPRPADSNQFRLGFYSTRTEPIFVSIYPILSRTGDTDGYLLFGRMIDLAYRCRIFSGLGKDVNDFIKIDGPLRGSLQPNELKRVLPQLSLQNRYLTIHRDSYTSEGYAIHQDIFGKPTYLLRVNFNRVNYPVQLYALLLFVLSAILSILLFLFGIYLKNQLRSERRIKQLTSSVNSQLDSAMLRSDDKDPLTQLAARIACLQQRMGSAEVQSAMSEQKVADLSKQLKVVQDENTRNVRFNIVYRLLAGVSRNKPMEEICQLAFDEIEREIKPKAQALRILKYESDFVLSINRGFSDEYIALMSNVDKSFISDILMESKHVYHIDELDDSFIQQSLRKEGIGTVAGFAMMVNNQIVGGYTVVFSGRRVLTETEEQLCEAVADTLSIVLQHHNSELERRSSEERLQSLFQTAHDGYIMLDGNGDVADVNPAASQILGYSSEVIIGKPGKHFLPIAFSVDYDNFIKKTVTSGVPSVITECITANGTAIPVDASASVIAMTVGSGIFVVLRDITERVHSERLQKTLLDIAQTTTESQNLEEMLANIHRYLTAIVYAENFYVALYDPETNLYSFPYQVDQYDPPIVGSVSLEKSLTDYVRRTKKPVLLDPANHEEWKQIDEIESYGTGSYSWLGIPLISKQRVIGVAVVQSYDEEFSFSQRDLSVMQLVSGQIATAIERKQAEESLRRSETRYRQIFSMTVAVKLFYDPNTGGIIDANQAACKFYGYTLRELKGMRIRDIELSSMDSHELLITQSTEAKQDVFESYRIALHKLKNGELRTVEMYSGPITMHDKLFVHAIVHDITSRVRTETENRRLAKLVESTAEAITITDYQGTILYVNPAFCKLTGFTFEETVGKNSSFLQSGKHDVKFYHNLWETILSGSTWSGRFINRKRDDSFYQSDAIIIPMRDNKDEIVSFAKIERDVTAELEMQERFQQAQRLASIGQLTGGIAHNFNNLLTGILGNLELIRMTGTAATLPLVSEAEKAGQRAADLVKQLMAFSRKSQLQRKAVDIYVLLQEVLGMLRSTVDRRIEITLTGQPNQIALGDTNQLHQVILNICMNAIDALKEASMQEHKLLQLALSSQIVQLEENDERLEAEAKPGQYCCITITDTGIGMSNETMKQIFEPFFTTKDVGKGTGLGLATAYGIVRQHDGWIRAESELGIGTTFHVYLPTVASPKAIPNGETSKEIKLIGGTETILVVDDEEMLRILAKTILERSGYTVRLATNGSEALALLSTEDSSIDLMLLDLSMPVMSGRELLSRLPELTCIPKVIVATGLSDQVSRNDHVFTQYEFVGKPYRISELLRLVRKVLDSK
ncbi:MAG: PAS domain S-box protein [bacterium]|nr:PAS domain S-box protein [bacterium]